MEARRLFLLGMMGAGKTTVGEWLSHRLGWPYVDNDLALTTETGLTVDELSALPLPDLHRFESLHAEFICAMAPPFVAGVAASVGDNADALGRLQTSGTCVYLAQTLETTLARVGTDGVGRQVLVGDGAAVLEARFLRRDPLFRAAATVVVEPGTTPPAAGDLIVAALRNS